MVTVLLGSFFSFILNFDYAVSLQAIYQDKELANSIFGLTHTSLVSFFVLHYYFTGNDMFWFIMKVFSMGYLLADSLYFYIYHQVRHSKIFLFHHIIFVFGWIISDDSSLEVKKIFYQTLLAELSSITLNCKNIAKANHYPILDLTFSLVTYVYFFAFRVVNFSLLFPKVYYSSRPDFIILLLPLTMLQYYWFYLMNLKIIKILNQPCNRISP